MRGRPNHPCPTNGQQRQQVGVVARVVGQRGVGDHDRGRADIRLGVLDRRDPGMVRQAQQRCLWNRDTRAVRDVVEHEGEFGGVGNGEEVSFERINGRARVVGGHHQQPVGTGLRGLFREFDRVARVEGADPGHHRGAVPDRLDHRLEQFLFLLVAGGGGFPGGSVDHQAVVSLSIHQVPGQPGRLGEVHAPVRPERGDHGGQQPPENGLFRTCRHGSGLLESDERFLVVDVFLPGHRRRRQAGSK